jgi:hypothetical protein
MEAMLCDLLSEKPSDRQGCRGRYCEGGRGRLQVLKQASYFEINNELLKRELNSFDSIG